MSWLGFQDGARNCFRPTGLPAADTITQERQKVHRARPPELLVRGTLVLECDFDRTGQMPARLIAHQSDRGWTRRLTIFLNADYSLSVEVQQGPARSYVRLPLDPPRAEGRLRISYTWDAPQRVGILTVESLDTRSIEQAWFYATVPLPSEDACAILTGATSCEIDPRVTYVALSDKLEQIGPMPTIAAGTLVETPTGPRPIEDLNTGDRVLTASGGARPVRAAIHYTVPAAGPFTPARICAPYFGLSRDIVVCQQHRLLVSGPDTEYLFGQVSALAEVRHLSGHPGVRLAPALETITYHQLLLDTHACLSLSGCLGESLFIGRLAQTPDILATTLLAGVPAASLPVHNAPARPPLRPFEARTLAEALSA